MFPSMFSSTMSEFLQRLSIAYASDKAKLQTLKTLFESLPDKTRFMMDFHNTLTPLIEDLKNGNDLNIVNALKTTLHNPLISLDIESMWTKAPDQTKQSIKSYILTLFEHANAMIHQDRIMQDAFKLIKSNEFLKSKEFECLMSSMGTHPQITNV